MPLARHILVTISESLYTVYTPFVLPEPEPFEQEVIIDIVFPGNTGNRGSWLSSQFNHLKFKLI